MSPATSASVPRPATVLAAVRAALAPPAGGRPAPAHRVLSALAALAPLGGIGTVWHATAATHPLAGGVVSLSYVAVIVLAAAAVTVRTARAAAAVDAAVLALGVLLLGCTVVAAVTPGAIGYTTDVGMVMEKGAEAIAAGHPLYGVHWPLAHSALSGGPAPVAPTLTMSGRVVDDYDYPPLAAVLGAGVHLLAPGLPAPVLVAAAGLALGALVLFLLLPAELRPAATLTCLGLSGLPKYAVMGFPALVALPFMAVAVASWPRIGRGGRLGAPGLAQGACLGLAAATQQLAWFAVPFLAAGIWLVRRGELPARAAAAVTLRWAVAAAAAFAAVDLPFVVRDPEAWAAGVTQPLLQHAVPHGQGLVGVPEFVTRGSGALDWLGYAAVLLAAGLLAAFVLRVRSLAPALVVLPWMVFFVSTRSQESYYLLFTPLWLSGAALWLHPEDHRRAHRLWGRRLRTGRVRLAAAATLPAAALVCALAAVAAPPPLRISVTGWSTTSGGRTLWQVRARVANRSDTALSPHFSVTIGDQSVFWYWVVQRGPRSLRPGQAADYVLAAPGSGIRLAQPPPRLTLRAVTDAPMTLSNAPVRARDRALQAVVLAPLSVRQVPPGRPVAITVQVRDADGGDVHRAGLPVSLRAWWIDPAVAVGGVDGVDRVLSVDGRAPVDGCARARTDRRGRAVFHVVARHPLPQTVVFGPGRPAGDSTVAVLWHAR